MGELGELASELEDALDDFHTWLPDAVREGHGKETVEALRDICNDILAEFEGEE